jgi:hypothetical protein
VPFVLIHPLVGTLNAVSIGLGLLTIPDIVYSWRPRQSYLLYFLNPIPVLYLLFVRESNVLDVVIFTYHQEPYFWLISGTNLMHKFFYSITICMLHYNPRHVSSINIPIFRRTNFIITALVSSLSVNGCTESDDTRCCDNTICLPEDGHANARNMSRIVM